MWLAVGKLPADSNQCYWSPKDQSDVTRPSPCWWDLGTRLGIRYYRLLVLNHFMTEITFIFLEHLASGRNKTDGMGHNCWELNPGCDYQDMTTRQPPENHCTRQPPTITIVCNVFSYIHCTALWWDWMLWAPTVQAREGTVILHPVLFSDLSSSTCITSSI